MWLISSFYLMKSDKCKNRYTFNFLNWPTYHFFRNFIKNRKRGKKFHLWLSLKSNNDSFEKNFNLILIQQILGLLTISGQVLTIYTAVWFYFLMLILILKVFNSIVHDMILSNNYWKNIILKTKTPLLMSDLPYSLAKEGSQKIL